MPVIGGVGSRIGVSVCEVRVVRPVERTTADGSVASWSGSTATSDWFDAAATVSRTVPFTDSLSSSGRLRLVAIYIMIVNEEYINSFPSSTGCCRGYHVSGVSRSERTESISIENRRSELSCSWFAIHRTCSYSLRGVDRCVLGLPEPPFETDPDDRLGDRCAALNRVEFRLASPLAVGDRLLPNFAAPHQRPNQQFG